MNELAEVQFQMPNTITDLVKWDAFYKARQAVYKQLLKNIKAWDEATDEEKRILKRAQDEAENLIDIHAVMGEMYNGLPQDPGGRHSKTATTTGGSLTPRQEFKEQTGLSDTKARRLVAISDHPDIVEEVKAEARNNSEIPTDTAILKRIEQARKEERDKIQSEMRDLKEERDYLKYQLEEAENKEPEVKEVIKEVVPDDYEELKRKAKTASAWEKDFKKEQDKVTKKQKEILELKDRVKELEGATKEGLDTANLSENVFYFCTICNNFIGNVGGLVWLTDRIASMPDKERDMFLKAANAFMDWSMVFKQNLERRVNEYECTSTDTGIPALPDKE